MLDPRIYRAAFLPVLFALVLLGFSLQDQPRGETAGIAPDAFDGAAAFQQLERLARLAPHRPPGSPGDQRLARTVERSLQESGFAVETRRFAAQTAVGERDVEAVLGERTGFSSRRLVVVAQRDALGEGARAELSGTAALLELARVLGARTLDRTLVLASVSGGADAARTLAGQLRDSADAVLVLGDLAGAATVRPLVVPWADDAAVAPVELQRTVDAALAAETGGRAGDTRLPYQFARLAFPLTVGLQGPFGGAGIPAVLLSASGERPPSASQPVDAERLTAFGRAALRTVSALDDGGALPPPAAYLLIERKLLPAWPVRLLALALLLPVLLAAVDGLARVRRRHERVSRWAVWVGACAAPFALAALLLRGLRLAGLLDAAPAAGGTAFPGVATPVDGTAVAALVSVAVVIVLGWLALRPWLARMGGAGGDPAAPGAACALLLVLCGLALVVWAASPFTALLLIPALHLWLLAIAPESPPRPIAALALYAGGLLAPLLVAAAYARLLGLGPLELAWMGALQVAGGAVGLPAALLWSAVLGCASGVLVVIVRRAGGGPAAEQHVTVRGPATYAGPGSLGGTESALRR